LYVECNALKLECLSENVAARKILAWNLRRPELGIHAIAYVINCMHS